MFVIIKVDNGFDAYEGYRFRVQWDGRCVAGFSKVSALEAGATELVSGRAGADSGSNRHLSGRTRHEAITLERGITRDAGFATWAGGAWSRDDEASASAKGLRMDVTIEIHDEAGQLAVAYKVYRSWVSELQILPDLEANGGTLVIELMKLENEGWEREERRTSR